MNNTNNSIISAMEIMAKKWAGDNSKYDRTVKTVITDFAGEGAYEVKLEGSTALAMTNSSEVYNIGDEVYITIRENDYNNIWIVGQPPKSADKLAEEERESLKQRRCGRTVSSMYGTSWLESKGLVAGSNKTSIEIFSLENGDHSTFQTFSDDYNYLEIYGEFQTRFFDNHTEGNYGIKVEVMKNENDIVTYKFDISEFNGQVYKFQTPAPQSILIPIGYNCYGLKSITFFQEGFDKDEYNDKTIETDNNIFVHNLELYLSLGPEELSSGYQLTFDAPLGYHFVEKEDKTYDDLPVTPQLRYNGKVLDGVTYTWFKQDLSVTVGSDGYSNLAGYAWKKWDTEGDNTVYFSKSDVTKKSNNYEQVVYTERFKVVAQYGELAQYSQEIEISDKNAVFPCKIEQKTKGDVLQLCLVNINSDDEDEYKGDWYYGKQGSDYTKINKEEPVNTITLGNYLSYTELTFYCCVLDNILSYKFTIPQAKGDMSLAFDGIDSFRYDASGDATFNSDTIYSLNCKVVFPEGMDIATKTSWYLDAGLNEPVPDETAIKEMSNSMISKIWVDSSGKIQYNVKSRYDINAKNNTLYIKVETPINQKWYVFEKDIEFLKDGDPGTNGTSYTVSIKPLDNNNQPTDSFYPIYYNSNKNEWTSLILHPIVKKNGVELTKNKDGIYPYSCSWAYTNVVGSVNEQNKDVNVELLKEDIIKNEIVQTVLDEQAASRFRYVTLTVTIEETNKEKIKLYAFYPIDVFIGEYDNTIKINDNQLPKLIQYNSSGENPIYPSSAIAAYNNEQVLHLHQITPIKKSTNIKNYSDSGLTVTTYTYTYEQQKQIDLLGVGFIPFNTKNLNPISKFAYAEERMAVLRCSLDEPTKDDEGNYNLPNNYFLRTVILYLNTYGNEAINGWDGTEVEIGFELDRSSEYTEGRRYYECTTNEEGRVIRATEIPLPKDEYQPNTYYYRTSIFAPQIGAGIKNSDNTFTGVIMGKDSAQQKIGLYGYQNGLNSFGLQEDGSAYFGKYNSRIWVKGEEATIYGGGGDNEKHPDFKISLTKDKVSSKNPAIEIGYVPPAEQQTNIDPKLSVSVGSYKFSVDYEGYMTAESGKIGDWYITGGILKSLGGNTLLNGSSGTITTGSFAIKGEIEVGDKNSQNHSMETVTGTVGAFQGDNGQEYTACLGVRTTINSIVLDSDTNVRLKGNAIYLDSYDIRVRYTNDKGKPDWKSLSVQAVFG